MNAAVVAPLPVVPAPAQIDLLDGEGAALTADLAGVVWETPDGTLPQDTHEIVVAGGEVRVRSGSAEAAFHARQTLLQLAGADAPAVRIVDRPRFAHRGFMLDLARHFFGPADIKRVVDHLAVYKLNVLHLHLTDDQGWRLEIEQHPALTEKGAVSAVGGAAGGFLTQDEYAELVAYAAERFITVVPEIDCPSHVHAALCAYPELSAEGDGPPDGEKPPVPYTGTEVGHSSFDARNEQVYALLEDVLTELAALTPGQFLHLGGDEAHSTHPDDYALFAARAQALVAGLGKRVLAWQELANAPLADGTAIQFWDPNSERGPDLLRRAVAAGAKIVMAPGDRTYLDMKPDPDARMGLTWAGLVDARDAYDWDPATLVDGVAEQDLLGVEACLWTETVETLADVEEMLFPRLAAVAEVAWTPQARRGWDDFTVRIAAHRHRWAAEGTAYYPSRQLGWAEGAEPATAASGA
ncbi:MAG TPA: family 20 glycosylhydrolase [Solirubrobacteraceae bacterium]|nr:family 20 glycosylhydrolase [Solirubrobacteraceae bacterium]